MTCARCGAHDGRMRTLWMRTLWMPSASAAWRWSVVSPVAPLCDDCNDLVQGPDHIDVTTDNEQPMWAGPGATELGWYCVAADCGRRFDTRDERAAHTREAHVVRAPVTMAKFYETDPGTHDAEPQFPHLPTSACEHCGEPVSRVAYSGHAWTPRRDLWVHTETGSVAGPGPVPEPF